MLVSLIETSLKAGSKITKQKQRETLKSIPVKSKQCAMNETNHGEKSR